MQYAQIEEKATWKIGVFYVFAARGPIFSLLFFSKARVFLCQEAYVHESIAKFARCSLKLVFHVSVFSHVFLHGAQ